MRPPLTRLLVIVGVLGAGTLGALATNDSGRSAPSAGPVAASVGVAAREPAVGDHRAAAAGCQVTGTRVGRPPGARRATSGWIEGDGLWIQPGDGTTFHTRFIQREGALRIAIHWRRENRALGRLWIGGHALPGPGRGFRFSIERKEPTRHLVRSVMWFRREGCWRITAKSGEARLKFVVWVVESDEA